MMASLILIPVRPELFYELLFITKLSNKMKVVISCPRTDFKFIGKVESQTNIYYKISVLAHLNAFFSKTNMFTNLNNKLLRKKKLGA